MSIQIRKISNNQNKNNNLFPLDPHSMTLQITKIWQKKINVKEKEKTNFYLGEFFFQINYLLGKFSGRK